MEKYKKRLIKTKKVDLRLIVSLLIALGVFSLIIFTSMLASSEKIDKTQRSKTTQNDIEQMNEIITEKKYDNEIIAVVKEINTENQRVTLLDTATNKIVELYYSGSSDVTDKFGQVISMKQLVAGMMVDVGYNKDGDKVLKLQISTKAWENVGVNNLSIDRSTKIMKIAQTKYKYNNDLVILDGASFIQVNNLAEQDELTIRGYDQVIWSITVTRGHGTVKMEDYEAFLGGNVTVGYEAIQQITEDMVITVREGNFNITVENEDYSGTKNITIYRNQETVVSMGDLGPETLKRGKITFQINPFGADLFVDGKLTAYGDSIELPYGEHQIKVSLGGYTTYTGDVNVEETGKTIRIDLPEDTSKEEATASIIEDIDNNQNTTDDDTSDNEDVLDDEEIIDDDIKTEDEDATEATDYIVDEDHFIYVQNPTGASVYLNGEFEIISPGSFKKTIGTHIITFIKDGYETKSYTVEVVDDGLDTYFSLPDMLKLQ